ncbi:MAG TPA: amidohydrolase [Pseudonocardiaceae bacterium]|jgi:amidohydrolase|nr:amidohydrolase [Pseudonocardiaceae bacterium]
MAEFQVPVIEPDAVHHRLGEVMADLAPTLTELSLDLHAHPELALAEHHAADRLSTLLADDGFTVERGVAGLPTSFVGSVGRGAPVIAFLCEYDALPGVGHGCGHNLIAAGGIGAALALHRVLGDDVAGTIRCIGTPGEEGAGGKITELAAGVFDDVDAALMFHPGSKSLPWRHATACVHMDVTYHGVASHAAGAPTKGRSALAAVIQLFTAIDSMRQFIPESARIHGIITDGGQAVNIVPERASAVFMARALTQDGVQNLVRRMRACMDAAAAATDTTVEVTMGEVYAERKNNHTIATRVAGHLSRLGVPMDEPVLRGGTGSSDIGNVSLVLPSIHPYLKIADRGTPGHSHAMAEAAASPEAQVSMLRMAEALAATGADLLADKELWTAVREEFDTSGPDFPV